MIDAMLFTVAFLWLFALSIRQANVSNWLEAWQRERDMVLNFIKEYKQKHAAEES